MRSSPGLSDVDFWYILGVRTEDYGACCCKLPQATGICLYSSPTQCAGVVSDYTSLFSGLIARNPKLKVILTVSPIRHIRDGMHANQLSKATLLLAIDQLQASFPEHVSYFPAYELLLDELRDYRFYADDMMHPSPQAVRYVWEKFVQTCFSADALEIMQESENINKALSHKPFHPESEEYKRFLGQIVLKIDRLNQKYPYLDFQNEKEICHIRLKQ